MLNTEGSGSRFCILIVLGRDGFSLNAVGDGGNVRYGGFGEGCWSVVYFGSKSNEAGVQSALMIANASFDPYIEAVVAKEEAEEADEMLPASQQKAQGSSNIARNCVN
jgi:hypothetical protein